MGQRDDAVRVGRVVRGIAAAGVGVHVASHAGDEGGVVDGHDFDDDGRGGCGEGERDGVSGREMDDVAR